MTQNWDKAKHGLIIRPKISLFGVGRLGHSGGEKGKGRKEEKKKKKEEGRREEEKKKKIQVWKYGIYVWNTSFVWNSWICLLGNHPNSFFVYVWVRKTLTLQYMCILVGSSQFCGWF